MTDDTTDTDRIEHDLAETRARMDRRLDELGTKLSPNQIVNDALAHVSGSDGADFAQSLIAKAKANPVPAALAGAGLVWLVASSQTQRPRGKPDLSTRLLSAEAGVKQLPNEHTDVHASRLDDVRGQVLGIVRQTTDTAASYAQRIKDAIANTNDGVREVSHDLRGATSDAIDTIGNKARRVRLASTMGSAFAQGAAVAFVGLIVGTLLPLSEQEERALGDLAGHMRGKGRDIAQEVVDRGSQVVGDALGAATESANANGLTTGKPVGRLLEEVKNGDLIGHVKEAAHEVVNAGKTSIASQLAPKK